MPKNRRRTPAGRATSRLRPAPPMDRPDEPDLVAELSEALVADHPIRMLGIASSLLNAVSSPDLGVPLASPQQDLFSLPPLAELIDSFLDSGAPATTALAWTLTHLDASDVTRARTARRIGSAVETFPAWLRALPDVEVYGSVQAMDPVFDGANVVIGARLPTGHELTVVAYVDFNLGGMLKDAFVIDESLAAFSAHWRTLAGSDAELTPISPADAKARINAANEMAAGMIPPLESDTWPACEPLLEWLMRLIPGAGRDFVRPTWTTAELNQLASRFFASELGRGLDDGLHHALLHELLAIRTDIGFGDPLHWSPAAVELIMLDAFPGQVSAGQEVLTRLPDLISAFIPFAHAEAHVPADLTAAALAAVHQCREAYLAMVDDPRLLRTPLDLLHELDLDAFDDFGIDVTDAAGGGYLSIELAGELDIVHGAQESLEAHVGGAAALAELDDEPLPEEAFGWADITPEIHDQVQQILDLTDACADELFDVEERTAARRLLHDLAVQAPDFFRRKSKPQTAAAAVSYMVAKANGSVGYRAPVQVGQLAAFFDLPSSTPQRVPTIRRALGLPAGRHELGSPRYLASDVRESIIERARRLRE